MGHYTQAKPQHHNSHKEIVTDYIHKDFTDFENHEDFQSNILSCFTYWWVWFSANFAFPFLPDMHTCIQPRELPVHLACTDLHQFEVPGRVVDELGLLHLVLYGLL